ncbi:Putative uncharacterized protein [Pseudomonas aeruginosa]|nr:conserved hypothetical protein [Pseudomonas aeruginosa 2192]CEI78325.1 Putative uncharacterized protein [Pseudomonas aeruginosa]
MALEDQVLGRQFIDEFEDIGKPGTASGAHAKTDTLALAAPLEGALHVFGGGFGHADGHCNSLLVTSGLEQTLLLLVVANGGLDGVFGENGAVDLHRRQGQLFGDGGVLDGFRLVQGLALHPLGGEGAGGDRGTATVGLELGVFDHALLVDLDLQAHHVAAGRRADHAGADVGIGSVELADVARVFVVVDDLFAICHG